MLDTLITKEVDISVEEGESYHVRLMPYRTLDNVIDGVVITFVDITGIKKSEEIRRLATVVRDSNDAITVYELDGTITAWNKSAAKMYGYSEQEALKMNITQLVPAELRKEAGKMLKDIKKGDVQEPFKTRRLTKDGRSLDVWLTITKLVDDAGDITSIATTERVVPGKEPKEPKE